MTAARFLEAVDQGLLAGLQEEHLRLQSVLVELLEHRVELLEVVAAAHVGDHGRALDGAPVVAEELAQGADHPRREVVDAEEAGVLEGGDRLGLAGAGVARDDEELDRLGEQLGLGSGHPPAWWSWWWMPRASRPGMPGTAASSSREAATILSEEPKWLRRARFRTGPTPRSSSRIEWVIARFRRLR